MNLIDIEDRLKDLSDQQLMQQMQRPDGVAPQFLVMSELKRRKEMRDKAPAPETTTVKDDLVQQGIASVANQMAPQDGIPRFSNGAFLNTGSLNPYALRQNIGSGVFRPSSDPLPFFSTLPRRQRRKFVTGVDLSQMPPDASVPNYAGDDIGIPPRGAYPGGPQMEGGTRRSGTYDAGAHHPPMSLTNLSGINPRRYESFARSADYPNFGVNTEGPNDQAVPQSRGKQADGSAGTYRSNITGGGGLQSQLRFGRGDYPDEVNAATDYDRAYNQIMSAPSSAAPAAPPTNYYEGIEKKLAALQEAETGPDTGMALLRAGLRMAEAGGEGKSTAAAIGAGGIAGLDAYEADKKAKQARQMQLMGVESQLAGAKTQQAYNQQKLALDTRMRDNQDKMLQLKGLGMSMEDKRVRDLAANQNQLKFMQLQLQEQKINLDADRADRKLDQMARDGKIKGDYYEALIRKADRGDSLDRYINATPEVRALLLPLLRKSNTSLQGDIGESAMKLMADPLWVDSTKDRLKEAAGGGEIGINAVVMEARRLAELGYGQRQPGTQAPRDHASIRR